MDISIGILAGGKSSRMGKDKAFLTVNQKTFLTTIADELSVFKEVLVSVESRERFSHLPYTFVEDREKGIGPVEGIRQIVSESKSFYTFICAVDMIFIKKEIVNYMMQFLSSDYDCYVISSENGLHPLCAIYSKNTLKLLEESINDGKYKLIDIASKLKTKYIQLKYSNFPEKILTNINTVKDYEKVKYPLVFCISGLKNSGKTTLIVKLIEIFKLKFSKIAVIKHDGHDFTIDNEDTDTNRFMKSGVSQVSIFSNYKYASIVKKPNVSVEEIISKIEKDTELIIIEGMKHSKYPKIEIIREEISKKSICEKENLIAIATDTKITSLNKELKFIPLSDTAKIAEIIMNYFQINYI